MAQSNYEIKQELRRQRYEELAEKAKAESDQAYNRSNSLVENIPPGQPILVGHHSEGRHRRTLEKSHAAMFRSIEASKKAEYYQDKAASVGSGGISSDDPDAINKLKQNLAAREANQAAMKAANKAKKGSFEPFELSNNNAQIRRLKERIKQLETASAQTTKEHTFDGFIIREDAEENRVMFLFDGKPSEEIRTILKSNGFRWAPSNSAWQRQLNGNGRYAANRVLAQIKK